MYLNKDRWKNVPVDDKTEIWMCVFLIPHQVLLYLHVRYILHLTVCVHTQTPGGPEERKLQKAHNSSLATHLPSVGRLLWVTIHMLWTMGLPLWEAYGLEGKGCEFTLPDAMCMWLVDNCGLFRHAWPQIIKDWSQAGGLDLEILHLCPLTPTWVRALGTDSFWMEPLRSGMLLWGAEEEKFSLSLLTFKKEGEKARDLQSGCLKVFKHGCFWLISRSRDEITTSTIKGFPFPNSVSFSSSLLSCYLFHSFLRSTQFSVFLNSERIWECKEKEKEREHKLTMGASLDSCYWASR